MCVVVGDMKCARHRGPVLLVRIGLTWWLFVGISYERARLLLVLRYLRAQMSSDAALDAFEFRWWWKLLTSIV